MSARTPFIPSNNSQARPASRATQAKDNATSTSARDSSFVAGFNNALNDDAVLKSALTPQLNTSQKGQAISEHESASVNKIPGKPSNLNGLLKKSSGTTNNLNLSGRKSLPHANQATSVSHESALNKSLSIRRDQAGTPSVFAPKPLGPNAVSAADILSASLKSPAFLPPSVPTLHTNETHIPTMNEGNGNPYPVSQYKFGNAPPHRVLLPSDDSTARSIPGPLIGLIPQHNRSNKKRGRAELEAEDDILYANQIESGPTKRYKNNEPIKAGMDAKNYTDEENDRFHSQAHFSPQLLSSPLERVHSPQSSNHGPHDYQQHTNGEGDSGIGPPSLSNESNMSVGRGDALDKLLGCQADAYIEEHIAKYEQLVTKWKECSMEDWVKGADEIMAKYTKILDFVRRPFYRTKLKLFTSFDQQLETHNSVLQERAKVLDGVKKKLVAQSGSILG
ncbi:hypothetical protein F5878DRAFT_528063 [Lentinula raphanica]|uniref:Extracellular mutant protein 11 C-terminal domain-containing protein n=1 Tax=Lentinula raphanica TaxID=153919 RepID=A0AA38PI70_9AGAR|nr:hypothetical protein F5878DRAFT_528063 [Lentinula raphanica]